MNEKLLALVEEIELELEGCVADIEMHTQSIKNAKETQKRLEKKKKQLLEMVEGE